MFSTYHAENDSQNVLMQAEQLFYVVWNTNVTNYNHCQNLKIALSCSPILHQWWTFSFELFNKAYVFWDCTDMNIEEDWR